VIGFGFVSLLADMVYEGARSLYGPALLALGASAATVGLVAGAGEAMALMLRLVAGPVADRRGAHWSFTSGGYALTAVCVPLMAVAPRLGAAGLVAAAVLILLERAGKAVRSPSKSALLAHAAKAVGRGTGFGVHKALDQTGAFAGPLLVAAVVAVSASLWWGYAALAVPGAAAMAVLLLVRARVPDPTVFDPQPATGAAPSRRPGTAGAWWSAMRARLGTFFRFAVAAAPDHGSLVSRPVAVHSPGRSACRRHSAGRYAGRCSEAVASSRPSLRQGGRQVLVICLPSCGAATRVQSAPRVRGAGVAAAAAVGVRIPIKAPSPISYRRDRQPTVFAAVQGLRRRRGASGIARPVRPGAGGPRRREQLAS
jgi:hypothetical protein